MRMVALVDNCRIGRGAERQSVGASAASPHLRQQCVKRFRFALLASLHPHFLSDTYFVLIE